MRERGRERGHFYTNIIVPPSHMGAFPPHPRIDATDAGISSPVKPDEDKTTPSTKLVCLDFGHVWN